MDAAQLLDRTDGVTNDQAIMLIHGVWLNANSWVKRQEMEPAG
jgi:hypothetical protein